MVNNELEPQAGSNGDNMRLDQTVALSTQYVVACADHSYHPGTTKYGYAGVWTTSDIAQQ